MLYIICLRIIGTTLTFPSIFRVPEQFQIIILTQTHGLWSTNRHFVCDSRPLISQDALQCPSRQDGQQCIGAQWWPVPYLVHWCPCPHRAHQTVAHTSRISLVLSVTSACAITRSHAYHLQILHIAEIELQSLEWMSELWINQVWLWINKMPLLSFKEIVQWKIIFLIVFLLKQWMINRSFPLILWW